METVLKRPSKSAEKESTTSKETTSTPVMGSDANFKRIYANQQELDHDLYKLEISSLKRNASYSEANPIWENVEHGHYYHSIDSRGRKQDFSNKVGGHFHKIMIDKDGNALCSKPLREVRIKTKFGRTITKFEEIKEDDHTHAVTYRFSEKIKPSAPNVEFAKYQSKVIESETKAMSVQIPDLIDE